MQANMLLAINGIVNPKDLVYRSMHIAYHSKLISIIIDGKKAR